MIIRTVLLLGFNEKKAAVTHIDNQTDELRPIECVSVCVCSNKLATHSVSMRGMNIKFIWGSFTCI